MTLPLKPGGVLRCCAANLEEALSAGAVKEEEGERIYCKYCGDYLIVRDGAWEWSGVQKLREMTDDAKKKI